VTTHPTATTAPRLVFVAVAAARLYLSHAVPPATAAAPARRSLLADVRDVISDETWMSWQQIAARLAEQLPDHYPALTASAVSRQMRACGVPSVDFNRHGRVLKGAKTTAVEQAIRREQEGR
jgi:hypothetical protein